MFDRFTDRAKKVMNLARQEAQRFNHEYLGTEHVLLGLVQEGSGVAANVLKQMQIDLDKIRDEVEKIVKTGPSMVTQGQLPFTPRAKKVLELSLEEASNLGHNYIGTEHLLLGLIKENEGIAAQVLTNIGVKLEDVREEVLDFLGAESADEEDEDPTMGEGPPGSSNGKSKTPALDSFGRDLTELARDGKLDVVIGRADEIERVIQILSRRTKNNPVLLGEPGVGKTAIVEGLAQGIINNEVPEILRGKRIVVLDLALMVAGTKYRGQFEERIKAVMNEVRRVGDVVLFIDELHTLVGAGGAEGAIDASNVLKPALSRGEIQCIGATTLDEYRKHIEKDGALERRFQSVNVDPPTPEQTVAILKGLRDRYEEHHRIKYTDEALEAAVDLSTRYINNRFLPDKAIDVIDEAGARVRIKAMVPAPDTRELLTQIEELERSKDGAVTEQDFEKAAQLRDQAYQLKKKKEEIQNAWRAEQSSTEIVGEVDSEVIAETVSKMTGIPLTRLENAEAERLLRMEDELGSVVIHQEEAIKAIARSIRRSRSGLKDPRRPTGSFIFLGPSGVGKTYLCKQLAKFMFGDEDAVITMDMSEYMEKHNASRLVGAPPGYVGYEEGGQLTERVRRRPYSVVLLDEIEKAHPDVFNMLLQIMEEGRLTDSFGRHVDFRNAVLIMTSNLGSQQMKAGSRLGFDRTGAKTGDSEADRKKRMNADVMIEVERHFRPEFLNRVDELVVFNPLNQDDLKRIVHIELRGIESRLAERGLALELDETATEFLIKQGFNADYGARPLRRAIERYIEDPLSEHILRAEFEEQCLLAVTVAKDGESLTFQPKDTTPAPPTKPATKKVTNK
ncbi:MAG: ATP-dependent Clp protease ATP-binding subunit [bacterium]|nr:ATP-dependent Clp protease ATP-binding subunit [Planctomycetota bacterium]HIL51781.1 ATP-dependent Clp protease ATP-binding subunit [Planctomycetota bacterium]